MLRFTIRDVLWLMVVIGMGLCWWVDRVRIGRSPGQLRTLVEVLADRGIHVELQPNSIKVQADYSAGNSWYYNVMIGEPIPKTR